MKKYLLLSAILFSIVTSSFAQKFNQDLVGTWKGSIARQDDSGKTTVMQFSFRKSDHTGKLICNRQFANDEGEIYNSIDDNFTFVYERNSAVYTWVNSGGVWTEMQTYLFTFNGGEIQLIHMRWVNNAQDDGTNEIWGYMQTGLLYKQ